MLRQLFAFASNKHGRPMYYLGGIEVSLFAFFPMFLSSLAYSLLLACHIVSLLLQPAAVPRSDGFFADTKNVATHSHFYHYLQGVLASSVGLCPPTVLGL